MASSTGCRVLIQCEECQKPRIVYSKKRILKKDKKLLTAGLEEVEFYCGESLFPPEFALVPKNNSQFDAQKNFFERFIVSPNITCDDPVQKNYYTMKNIPTICNVCCTDLSDNKEILDLIITKKKEYVSVTPSCRSVDCGDFICLRKKKIKRSRSSEGAKPNPAKRRRQEEENGGS
jgi:hypothetical protein